MATASFRQALNLDPSSNEARQSLGLLLFQQEEYQEAIDILRPIAEADKHNLPVQQAFASALERIGHEAEALEIIKSTYEHYQKEEELVRQLGRLMLKLNQIEAGIEFLTQELDTASGLEVVYQLAVEYVGQKEFARALTLAEQIIELDSAHEQGWRMVAECQLELNNLDQALMAADQALALNQNNLENWRTKAKVSAAQGQINDALSIIKSAPLPPQQPSDSTSSLGREFTLILDCIGIIFRLHKEFNKTVVDLIDRGRELFNFDKKHEILIFLLLKKHALLNIGEYEQAFQVLQEILKEKYLDKEDLRQDYFYVYHGLNRPADALKALQSALDKTKDREKTFSDMEAVGAEFLQKGQTQTARLIFEQILAVAPERLQIKDKLALILASEKQ
jgi:tetratricopeptide (TPR) repeat protein